MANYKPCLKCNMLMYLSVNGNYICPNDSCKYKEQTGIIPNEKFFKLLMRNDFGLVNKSKSTISKPKKEGCSLCFQTLKSVWKEPHLYFYGKMFELCQDCYDLIFNNKSKYFCSKCHQPFFPRFEWATMCYNCWKINQIEPEKKMLIETIFPQNRRESAHNDILGLQKQREKFIENLQKENKEPIELTEMYSCKELQEGSIHTSFFSPQYFLEYRFCNTRKKLNNESIAEFDNLPLEQAVEGISFIALRLIQEKQNFMIFYAEGQRSPHIRLYKLDFLNELSEFQRLKAITLFWRTIAGEFYKFLDKNVWVDNHFVPLEFAPHWKYHTPYVCFGGLKNE